jgi:hypothetical protein
MDLRNVEEFNIFMNRWEYTDDFSLPYSGRQGVTNICRLSWLTNSALVYEPKCGSGGGWGRDLTVYLTSVGRLHKIKHFSYPST